MKGWVMMSRFNLIYEPWIKVLTLKGENEMVSLKTLFKNASLYKQLAGETVTQDFAMLRVILAILHTVFSRYDSEGTPYYMIEFDKEGVPKGEVSEFYSEEYEDDLYETWENLWNLKSFPEIVYTYLNQWEDHFYLFDETYPFMQVIKEDVATDKLKTKNPTKFWGKNLNRTISESNNKIALFSPKSSVRKNKDILSEAEIARWLLSFHGYIGLADKSSFKPGDYKSSKGWLFDIGGLYVVGETLFETLVLNLVLVHPEKEFINNVQRPAWEQSSSKNLKTYFPIKEPNNLAELYTTWSRAVYIDPQTDVSKPFSMEIVKLPLVPQSDQLIEVMTLWRFHEKGENANSYTPRKHLKHEALWRNFGLMTNTKLKNTKPPAIISWVNDVNEVIGFKTLSFMSVSMEDDGNSTSWVPVNEIYDELIVNDLVIADKGRQGWVSIINDQVDLTKKAVSTTYRNLLKDIQKIRNVTSNTEINAGLEELYGEIDQPFKEWIRSIHPTDKKYEKVSEWQEIARTIIYQHAKKHLENTSMRDYRGIVENDQPLTITIAFDNFVYWLNQLLGREEN